MLKLIKDQLLRIVNDIDVGNTNINEEEMLEVLEVLNKITYKDSRLSKYQACQYLNISRATFDNYIREGKLPKGRKEAGFKELSWTKKDLDNFKKKSRNDFKEKHKGSNI